MLKKILISFVILSVMLLAACSPDTTADSETGLSNSSSVQPTESSVSNPQGTALAYSPVEVEYDNDDLTETWNDNTATRLYLDGSTIEMNGSGAVIDGNTVTITSAGTYVIGGTLDDGQIIVNSRESGLITLVFDGVNITCSTTSPVFIDNAEKVVLILAHDSLNYVTDGLEYVFADAEEDEPNAAIFSKSDLTITGSGKLIVSANYNNGIQSKDGLKITGGVLDVTAVNDGIKGKDYVAINGGIITIDAGGDGIQSTNDSDAEKGFVAVQGGNINITAGLDGIQGETNVYIEAGTLTITTGGGSQNASTSSNWGDWGRQTTTTADNGDSAKGIKAGIDLTIAGGTITIDSSDDALHSNDTMTVSSGIIKAASGDDGMHADSSIDIAGGSITITKSYEGIESHIITVNGGETYVTASDHGINGSGGSDGSSMDGRPGQNTFSSSSGAWLYMNGGTLVVDAGGDGIDINGSIEMNDGYVIVNGPTDNGNGPLDYLGTCDINGGFIIASGSAGMAQSASDSSEQNSLLINLSSMVQAGTSIHIQNSNGDNILTFAPSKNWQSIMFSSPDLITGDTITISGDGTASGNEVNGVYDGNYSGGTELTTFTISNTVTRLGSSASSVPGGMPGRR